MGAPLVHQETRRSRRRQRTIQAVTALIALLTPWMAPPAAQGSERSEGRLSGISHAVRTTLETPFGIPAPVFGSEASVSPGPFAKSNAFVADGRTVGLGYTVVAGLGGALPPFAGIPMNAEAVQGPGEEDKTNDSSAVPPIGPFSAGRVTAKTTKSPEAEGIVTAAGVNVEGVVQIGSLVSRSLSTTDPATGAVRGEFVQHLTNVVAANGLFKAGSMDIRVTLSANGKPGGSTATASFNLSGASVKDVPVVLDEHGLRVQDQQVPADAKGLLPTVKQLLGPNGAVVPPLMTLSASQDGRSASVLVTGLEIDLTPPPQPDPIGSKALRLSFGSVMAEAVAEVSRPDPGDLGSGSVVPDVPVPVAAPPSTPSDSRASAGTAEAPRPDSSATGATNNLGPDNVGTAGALPRSSASSGTVAVPNSNGRSPSGKAPGTVTRTVRGGQASVAFEKASDSDVPIGWKWPYGWFYAVLLGGVGSMGLLTRHLVRFARLVE